MSPEILDDAGPMTDVLGATQFGARRLHYSERLSTADPGTRLSAPITDGGEGAGISFPLTGLWGSTDWAGAYPYVLWSLDDVFGAPLDATSMKAVVLTVLARPTVPLSADEWRSVLAVVNESDLTSGTIDGAGCGSHGTTAGGYAAASASVANGTANFSTSTANANIVGANCAVLAAASVVTGLMTVTVAAALDSSGTRLTSSSATATVGTGASTGRLYVALAAGRISAGGLDNITLKLDAWVHPILRGQAPS